LTTGPKMSGLVSGGLEIHGPPASLEGTSTLNLRDFVFGNEPRISADLETRTSLGTLSGKANLFARGSDPVALEASVPYKFEKQEAGFALKGNGPSSATLNFPAILLSKLPRYLSRGVFFDGILSGRLAFSNSLLDPLLLGNLHLINGRFAGGMSLSTAITLRGKTAAIDFAQFTKNNVRYGARGGIDFRELTNIATKIFPNGPMAVLTPLEPGDCIDGIELFPGGPAGLRRERIDEIDIHGNLLAPDWTISLGEKQADDPLETLLRGGSSNTFPICRDLQPSGKRLILGQVRPFFP